MFEFVAAFYVSIFEVIVSENVSEVTCSYSQRTSSDIACTQSHSVEFYILAVPWQNNTAICSACSALSSVLCLIITSAWRYCNQSFLLVHLCVRERVLWPNILKWVGDRDSVTMEHL